MAAWLEAIPIVGKVIEKISGLIGETVTDKDKANELTIKLKEILTEFLGSFYKFVIDYEGEFRDLVQLGIVGKILAVARSGWRPALQWGLTADILQELIIRNVHWTELETEILFTLGLAGLRTVEKALPFPKKKGNNGSDYK